MKSKILTILAIVVMAIALPGAKDDLLEFAEKTYDFGTVDEHGEPVVHDYTFVNISDQPVAILSVSTGCGCTHPSYPTQPVAPGATGVIKITFNPLGQDHSVNKQITVRYRGAKASASRRVTLRLRGRISK